MSQSSDMDRLTKELREASNFRMAAIKEMRRAAKSTLAQCATRRGKMAHEYRAQMQKFVASLTKEVAAQRHADAGQIAQTQKLLAAQFKDVAADRRATGASIARIRSSRHKAATPMRAALQQHVEAIKQKTDKLRADAAQTVRNFASTNEKMAKQQRSALAAERRKLRTHMASFLKAAHADQMKAHIIWKTFAMNGGGTSK